MKCVIYRAGCSPWHTCTGCSDAATRRSMVRQLFYLYLQSPAVSPRCVFTGAPREQCLQRRKRAVSWYLDGDRAVRGGNASRRIRREGDIVVPFSKLDFQLYRMPLKCEQHIASGSSITGAKSIGYQRQEPSASSHGEGVA